MINKKIQELFASFSQEEIISISKLPESGSNRKYYRINCADKSYIVTDNNNVKENTSFISFTNHFKKINLPVPTVYAISEDGEMYIQEDLGTASLLNILEEKGHCDEVKILFKKSLKTLAHLQIKGHEGFDYAQCLTAHEFGKNAIMSDLLYFKYYFLDTLSLPYEKQQLLDEFEALSFFLSQTKYKFFMFRDFQSRNIIVNAGEVYFIDYQGGMRGALQYDAASLLWQARANLSDDWKVELINYYIDEVNKLLPTPVNKEIFQNQYRGYVLIRLLQVLGAYGFRGLFERKAHFLSSIPLALENLKWFIRNRNIGIELPEFERILGLICSDTIINQFTPPVATDVTPLVVEVNSFSYRKQIPEDTSGNGGGFVFDCRGILNPGRTEAYKKLTGQDKPVQDFLEQKTQMKEFLNSVFDIVDINVETYLERGFDHLQINFGCTGGQHRSVYAAEQTARHLRNKYKVKTILTHTNKENWVK